MGEKGKDVQIENNNQMKNPDILCCDVITIYDNAGKEIGYCYLENAKKLMETGKYQAITNQAIILRGFS